MCVCVCACGVLIGYGSGGWRPGQAVQVLHKQALHLEDSQYTVEEVSEWSGCRGSVVAVRDEDASVRVDFSTELMKRVTKAENEAEQLRHELADAKVCHARTYFAMPHSVANR